MARESNVNLANKLGFWSAVIIAFLVIFIDVGMIASTILFPMTSLTSIGDYASSFRDVQMLPFIPSLILGPMFVIMMLCINHTAFQEKKIFSQLGFSFAVICAAVLSLHYYIQLTFVRQSILSNALSGVWMFAAPNPHSFFWTLAALGYGFMGFSLLSATQVFSGKSERAIKWLFATNGIIGVVFLVGNALGIFMVDILVSFVWGVLFPITTLLLARKFRNDLD
jgi:hypothetical protein